MIGLKYGDLKDIAETLGVSHVAVRMEASGRQVSKRIRAAIIQKQRKNMKEWQKQAHKATSNRAFFNKPIKQSL